MKPLIVHYYPLLKALSKIKPATLQQKVLRKLRSDEEFVRCLREVCRNIADSIVKLSDREKRRLNRHSKVIRGIIKKQKKQVEQSGGFIQIAVPLLASVISSLLAK